MGCRPQHGFSTCSAKAVLLLFCVLVIPLCNGAIQARSVSSWVEEHTKRELDKPQNGSGIKKYYYLYNMCSQGYVQLFGSRKKPKAHQKTMDSEKQKRYGLLRVEGTNFNGQITIQSHKFHWYLCFNKNGRLIVRENRPSKNSRLCGFTELQDQHYTEFQSLANTNWKIGFKKNGKPLPGAYADRKRKCYRFLKEDLAVERGQGPVKDSSKLSFIRNFNNHRGTRSRRKHRRRRKS